MLQRRVLQVFLLNLFSLFSLSLSAQIGVDITNSYDTVCPGGIVHLGVQTTGSIELSNIALSSDGVISADAVILSNGGYPVLSKGFVWSTSPQPSTEVFNGFITVNSAGLDFSGAFEPNLSGQIIYVRAFANNGIGNFLSNELSVYLPNGSGVLVDCSSTYELNPDVTYGSVSDIEGRQYKTVQIGRRTWMAENLRTRKFQNGDLLPIATTNEEWNNQTSAAWCYPNNDEEQECEFGIYYNAYVTTDTRNVCPTGWRVPTTEDWGQLLEDISCEVDVADNPTTLPANSAHLALQLNSVNPNATNSSGLSLKNNFFRTGSGFLTINTYSQAWAVSTTGAGVPYQAICYTGGLNLTATQEYRGNVIRCVSDVIASELPSLDAIDIVSLSCSLATVEVICPEYDGSNASDRGIYWSQVSGASLQNAQGSASAGCGRGNFMLDMEALAPSTGYFVTAYAIVDGQLVESDETLITTPLLGCNVCNPDNIFSDVVNYETISDVDGNTYKTVLIGSRKWMAENLKTTRFNNGVAINQLTSLYDWNLTTTPVWTYYNNDPGNDCPFGKLYNNYTVTSQNEICPLGWHVPTLADWQGLETALVVEDFGHTLRSNDAGYWLNDNGTSSNSSGFSAVPQGYLQWNYPEAIFNGFGYAATWWVEPFLYQSNYEYYRATIYSDYPYLQMNTDYQTSGHAIRCVSNQQFSVAQLQIESIQINSLSEVELAIDIMTDGGSTIIQKGVVWNTSGSPTIEENDGMLDSGSGFEDFMINVNNLSSGTNYYFRAYAVNGSGVSYSEQQSIATLFNLELSQVINVTDHTAAVIASIDSDGTGTITLSGFCWSTSPMPDLENNLGEIVALPVELSFNSLIENLAAQTTYYVRAYGQNSGGLVFSNQQIFTTLPEGMQLYNCNPEDLFNPFVAVGSVADVDGNVYRTVQVGSQVWMAENLRVNHFNNGDPIPQLPTNGWELSDFTPFYQPGLQYPIFNNQENCEYGNYYNGYVIFDDRNVCPAGWHVPDNDEWSTLIATLGGPYAAVVALRTSYQAYWLNYFPYVSSNSSGFSAIPSGDYRLSGFNGIDYYVSFMTSTPTEPGGFNPHAYIMDGFDGAFMYLQPQLELQSGSIRCVQD